MVHGAQERADLCDEELAMAERAKKHEEMLEEGWLFSPLAPEEKKGEGNQAISAASKDKGKDKEKDKEKEKEKEIEDNEAAAAEKKKLEETAAEVRKGAAYIGARVRRFFVGHGKSDGVVRAYLPADQNQVKYQLNFP